LNALWIELSHLVGLLSKLVNEEDDVTGF